MIRAVKRLGLALALPLCTLISSAPAAAQGLFFPGPGTNAYGVACTGNAMQQYLCGSMAVGQWKLWTSPGRGGVIQNAVTASISGTTMTVSASTTASIGVGQFVTGGSTSADTRVTALGTGSGGTGTYTVSQSQTIASTSLNIGAPLPLTRANFDGSNLWDSDAALLPLVAANTHGGAGPIFDPYYNVAVNPFNGDALVRGGGHNTSLDSGIYGGNLFTTQPGSMTWSMRVASARSISAAEPVPAWYQSLPKTSFVATTGSGTAGTNSVTVASTSGMGLGGHVYAPGGGIPAGSLIDNIVGNVLTLVHQNGSVSNLTSNLSGAVVNYSKAAYNPTTSRTGVQMPPSVHIYSGNTFVYGSDTLLLSGLLTGGGDYSGNIGGGWAYSPSKVTNDGMYGPFQIAATATGPLNPDLWSKGWAMDGTSGSIGCAASNDVDGKTYAFGRSFGGGLLAVLWRYDNLLTAPTMTKVGGGTYAVFPPSYYTNCVIVPDPKVGGNGRMFFHDQRNITNGNFAIWNDIGSGAATVYSVNWTNAFPTMTASSQADAWPSYTYNSDLGVMAFTDGTDVWEFPITWNGSAYVTGAFTKLTTSGDVPTQASSYGSAFYTQFVYLPTPYKAYALCLYWECRVLKRAN